MESTLVQKKLKEEALRKRIDLDARRASLGSHDLSTRSQPSRSESTPKARVSAQVNSQPTGFPTPASIPKRNPRSNMEPSAPSPTAPKPIVSGRSASSSLAGKVPSPHSSWTSAPTVAAQIAVPDPRAHVVKPIGSRPLPRKRTQASAPDVVDPNLTVCGVLVAVVTQGHD